MARRTCRPFSAMSALRIVIASVLLFTAGNILRSFIASEGNLLQPQAKIRLRLRFDTDDTHQQSRINPIEAKGHNTPIRFTKQETKIESDRSRMAARISQRDKFCQGKKSQTKLISNKGNSSRRYKYKNCQLVSFRRHFKFCPIAKVGSTFWNRFYRVLNRQGSTNVLESPFTIPLKDADKTRCEKPTNNTSFKEPGRVINALFVREPFSRVFSAYVDKLLAPNPTYWRKWGKPAMTLDNVTAEHAQCGHHVTFRQFIRLINDRLFTTDNHVIPMVGNCDPCTDEYDVIGHMETFANDLNFTTSLLNVTFHRNVSLSHETKIDAIVDSVESPFGWKTSILKCISSQEMGRRIWRKLQIRGLVSNAIDYPFPDQDISGMSANQFSQAAFKAHAKSTDKKALRRQKEQAFVEAFRTVPLDELRKYLEIYADDFEAFGYEKYPDAVFGRGKKVTDTHALDFEIPWRISAK